MASGSDNTDFTNLMRNIKWLRAQNNLSKKEMARLLGIGTGSLTKLEAGVFPERLGVQVLFRVYARFGIPPRELLGQRLSHPDQPHP